MHRRGSEGGSTPVACPGVLPPPAHRGIARRHLHAPAGELAEPYAARWTSETIYKNIKIEQRGGRTATQRSKSPALIEQELWAMLRVCQVLRRLIADTVSRAGLPVTHVSFKNPPHRRPTHRRGRLSPLGNWPPSSLVSRPT